MAVEYKKVGYNSDISVADSKAVSAQAYASSADTSAVTRLSTVDSTLQSQITEAGSDSVARSMATSAAAQASGALSAATLANGDADTADSKAVSAAAQALAADSTVASSASTADSKAVSAVGYLEAHHTRHISGGADAIALNEFLPPTGTVDIDGKQLQEAVTYTVANVAALSSVTHVVGMPIWVTAEGAVYYCTSAA
jgi:hypothetical protein